MAREDFLGCLSKTWIEKVGSSLRVLPRPRAKDTGADVVKQAFQRLPGMRRASSTWSAFSELTPKAPDGARNLTDKKPASLESDGGTAPPTRTPISTATSTTSLP